MCIVVLWLVSLLKSTIWFLQQTLMSVNSRRQTTAMYMLTALTQLAALIVPVTVDLKEMESTVQVRTLMSCRGLETHAL